MKNNHCEHGISQKENCIDCIKINQIDLICKLEKLEIAEESNLKKISDLEYENIGLKSQINSLNLNTEAMGTGELRLAIDHLKGKIEELTDINNRYIHENNDLRMLPWKIYRLLPESYHSSSCHCSCCDD